MKKGFELFGKFPATGQAADMNALIRNCLTKGSGLFVELLREEVERRRLRVPFVAHDLIAELSGDASTLAF